MQRTLLTLAFGLVLAGSAAAETQVYYGFHVGISNAPPPPRIVYREAPEVVLVPGSQVYVVEDDQFDCDVFRVGPYWYAQDDGYWYRARSYRGPFTAIDVRRVPRAVFSVPARNWRHHPHGGPPGLTRRYESGNGHRRDQGHHRGNGRGKVAHNDH